MTIIVERVDFTCPGNLYHVKTFAYILYVVPFNYVKKKFLLSIVDEPPASRMIQSSICMAIYGHIAASNIFFKRKKGPLSHFLSTPPLTGRSIPFGRLFPTTASASCAAGVPRGDWDSARQRSRRPHRARRGKRQARRRPARWSSCCCLAGLLLELARPARSPPPARSAGSSHRAATDGDEPGRLVPCSPTLARVNGRRPLAVPLSLLRLRTHSPFDPARPPRRSSTTAT